MAALKTAVKEMKFSIFSKVIAWFKKIFRIYSKKGTQFEVQSEIEQRIDIEKKVKAKSYEEKAETKESSRILEGIGKEKEAKKELIDEKEEGYREEKEKREVAEKKDGKKLEEEKERKKKKGKPYKKKSLTEPGKVPKKTTGEKKKTYLPRRKVDLGKRRQTKRIKRHDISEGEKKLTEPSTRVVAPFVEVNLDEAKIFLVIPKQSFRTITESISQKQLNYQVKLNDEEKVFQVSIAERGEYLEIAEKRIELEKPIQNFEVIFPSELGNRTYRYEHQNDFIYVFIAVGNNLGRMHYLYDINGNINSLPQKEIWILLKEDFELGIEPDVIEDTWVWVNYRPLCINLKDVSKLVVKDRNTNEDKVIPCVSTFSIDSEEVVYDDFGEQFPIFTGNSIEIKAPIMNEEGWRVWVQNKQASYKIVSDDWSGKEPLKLNLDRDIPCECGEFQVDICEQDREPVTTLFFRYIPSLRLNYPKELIIPNSKKGHRIEKIEVSLQAPGDWEIETSQQIKSIQYGYEIDLPPEIDTLRFSISKKDKPETKTNFMVTIPRLKWKTSRQEEWIDKVFDLARKELITGKDFYFVLRTNTLKPCDFLIFLETEGRELQRERLNRKGKDYLSTLNQFYDTLKLHHTNIVMKVREVTTLREVEVINFLPPELACKLCSFTSYYKKQILSHVKEKHLCEFFEPLTFEELRNYDSSLPYKIYKCSYCGFYVKEDNFVNPTNAICNHIEKYCSKVDRSKGPPRVEFQVISDVDEIRRNVLPNLPNYQKCKLCGKHITTSNVERLLGHLIEFHESELYIVKGE